MTDIARGLLMDAALHKRAADHARDCPRCAAVLADECSLMAGLRALAAEDDRKVPTPKVEAGLLAAFRRDSLSKPPPLQPVRAVGFSRWMLAAAAVILIALGLAAYRAIQTQSPKRELNDGGMQTISTPAQTPQTRNQDSESGRPIMRQDLSSKTEPSSRGKRSQRKHIQRRAPDHLAASQPPQFMIRDGMTLYASDIEVATDFLPFTYSSNLPPMESGQLIRVQMPRSALLKFGLPMNFERANVPVKADLLLGNDGLAQAIRFIR